MTNIGDLFQIGITDQEVFLHYVYDDERIGQLIRVFTDPTSARKLELEDLAYVKEKFMIFFPLKAAVRRKIVKKVGCLSLPPNFRKPKFMRTKHTIRGEFRGWHIVNTDTWQAQLVANLSEDQKKLSPWGVWNDTLLIQRLEDGWNLEDWS